MKGDGGRAERLRMWEDMGVVFLQAEDGIRVAQEARGLRDVDKRRGEGSPSRHQYFLRLSRRPASRMGSVSYTHLTLPTSYTV